MNVKAIQIKANYIFLQTLNISLSENIKGKAIVEEEECDAMIMII